LEEGAISYIFWADRLLELPLSLVSVSLGTALLPTLAGLWSQGHRDQMSETVNYYLRLNLFVTIPAALGLYFLALPIVEVLFMRGRFTGVDAEATAAVLRIYSLLLISTSCVRVLVPAYHAIKNTWFPAVVSAASLLSHILLAPILMKEWGLEGLVVSALISATLNIVLLLSFFPKLIGTFDYFKFALHLVKFAFAGVGMVIILQVYGLFIAWFNEGVLAKILALSLTILLGAGGYLALSFVLKVEELKALKAP
jgi:putative peptidoglycan lipid II flippase